MPLPQPAPRSTRIGLGAHVLMIAAIVLGLLGMHVLASQGSHAAHGSPPTAVATSMESRTAPHHAHDGAIVETDPTLAETSLPNVWAVVCVVALLLTVILVAPNGSSWLIGRRDASWRAAALGVPVDRAPQHPPSLTLLSISRT
ncbi:DUF6153 family protein [Microbacterium sp. LWH7-1.2]|jgi:quinol-cytochrome oxidoreductase complex cytochrome b subunit|uniref:DUF6153 family protein n=1 Tax=Microbacterium sp. LWH7-1.2 TaxID=3135257 RepID=UPI00313A309B